MGRVIRGWDEAIMQMTVGQTAGVFIQAPWVRDPRKSQKLNYYFRHMARRAIQKLEFHQTKTCILK